MLLLPCLCWRLPDWRETAGGTTSVRRVVLLGHGQSVAVGGDEETDPRHASAPISLSPLQLAPSTVLRSDGGLCRP